MNDPHHSMKLQGYNLPAAASNLFDQRKDNKAGVVNQVREIFSKLFLFIQKYEYLPFGKDHYYLVGSQFDLSC